MRRLLPLSLLLALVLVAAAPAATARDGLYRGFAEGTTDPQRTVKFRLAKKGRQLTMFRVTLPVTCPDDGTTRPAEIEDVKVPVSRRGRFSFGYTVGSVGEAGVKGRITARGATGTAEYGDGACGGEMRWTAVRVKR